MPRPQPTLTELLISWPEDAENQFAWLFARALGGSKAVVWLQDETAEPGVLKAVGTHGFTLQEQAVVEVTRLVLQEETLGARALRSEKVQLIWTRNHQEMGLMQQLLREGFPLDTLYCCALKLPGEAPGLIYAATPQFAEPAVEDIVSAAQVAQALTTGLHQKRLRSQMLRTENRVERILQSSVDLILTLKGREITRMSPSSLRILGYTPQEMIGYHFMRYLHPEDVEHTLISAGQLDHRGDVVRFENRCLHKDGHTVHLEWHCVAGEGEIVGVARDVSRRKRDEQKLKAALEVSTQLVGLTADLEETNDPDQVILLALQQCTSVVDLDFGVYVHRQGGRYLPGEMTGITPDEVQPLIELYLQDGASVGLDANQKSASRFFNLDEPAALPVPSGPDSGQSPVQLAVLPIPLAGKLHGVMLFGNRKDRGGWKDNTVRLLSAVRERIIHVLERNLHIQQLSESREETLRALGVALEYRDYETKGHTDRVVQLSEQLGVRLGLTGETLDALRWGAYLHDTGKIAIPDHILLKPGKLTPEEYDQVKKHSEMGFEMLRHIPSLPEESLEVVLHHHERWNGSGYPRGLAFTHIPLLARIFAVVDVYDALVSRRPYKKPFRHEAALEELRRCSGTMFDPVILETFEHLMLQEGPLEPKDE